MNRNRLFLSVVLIIFLMIILFCCGCDLPESDDGTDSSTADDDSHSSNFDKMNDDDDDNDNNDNDDDDIDHNNHVSTIDVTVHDPPAENILARKITVTSKVPISIQGRVSHHGEPGFCPSDPPVTATATEHELWFYGLFPDSTFDYKIYASKSPREILASGKFDTPSLPDWYNYLPDEVSNDPATVDQSYWSVMTINQTILSTLDSIGLICAFDRDGRLRFFHEIEEQAGIPSLQYSGVRILENGNISWNDRNNIMAVNPKGEEATWIELHLNDPILMPIHHHAYIYPGEPRQALVIFNHFGQGEDCDGNPVNSSVYDGVALVDENGIEMSRWTSANHWEDLTPAPINDCLCGSAFWGAGTYDFTHANSVYPVPGEQAFVISLRNLNRIAKIDTTDGSILWQLGQDENADFTWIGPEPDDEKWFLMQHDAHLLSPTRMILFDNEDTRLACNLPSDWSRAMELEIDQDNKTVEIVWEYRMPFAYAMGDVERLENGNTFISGGSNNMLAEVDSFGDEIWHVHFSFSVFANTSSGRPMKSWWRY